MIKQSITLQECIEFLNEMFHADPEMAGLLIQHEIPCNQAIVDHPSIQVTNHSTVRFLGILNGLFGSDDRHYGAIAAIYENDKLIGFGDFNDRGDD